MSLPPFQRILDAHAPQVQRFLVAAVGRDDADDCFQETFLSALRAYPRLRHRTNLRAWVLTIAHRKAIDSHQVILGMSESQVQLALGQVSKSVSEETGNRLVVYSNLGHPMAVTFVKDHVTAFRPDQGY